MLYTLISDSKHYRGAVIDSDFVASQVGGLRDGRLNDRIDVNHQPRSWQGVFSTPIPVRFPAFNQEDKNKAIPDIAEFQGRLFLNEKAYSALKQFIEKDGDLIPAISESGNGYIFTPLRKAEDVDALDKKLNKKSDWGDVEHLVFIEEKLKSFSLFRADYTNCMNLYCQETIKNAIANNDLSGLYITNDLANIFPEGSASLRN
ncbi:MAG: hypothetical protein B0W54_21525 [Cellvibrio sp. 79]|nr:MAG: hypothetical protein B0W54_21525 [Cellvibrio sp. 79]